MGTKLNPGKFDCYAAAEPDEPLFTLLARDPLAATTVREWAFDRQIARGPNPKSDEAYRVANAMDEWRIKNRG